MKQLLIALAAVLVFAAGGLLFAGASQAKPLGVGAAAPNFTTQGALAGKPFTFSLSDKLKTGPVVLYFYPKAFTKGCTMEAHEFAEKTEAFNKLGATVIGMSADKIETLQKFSTEECRDKFAVAVATPEIIKAYGVQFGPTGMSNRTSFVIAKDDKITMVHSELDYKEHVSKSLAAVQALAKAK